MPRSDAVNDEVFDVQLWVYRTQKAVCFGRLYYSSLVPSLIVGGKKIRWLLA
jgi:hypothetical protein